MKKLLLIDSNTSFVDEFKNFFQYKNDYDIYSCHDGLEGINLFNNIQPDILVMDLILSQKDGLYVLQNITIPSQCKVLVLSPMIKQSLIVKTLEMGADYCMITPCTIQDIYERIEMLLQLQSDENVKNNHEIDKKISDFFMVAGIPANVQGYQFLREAVKLAINDPNIINSITKKLYPSVARHFNTTPSKVERAIRHAIEVAFNRGKIENINNLFGIKVYTHNDKPTNGEFIALVADKILLDCI